MKFNRIREIFNSNSNIQIWLSHHAHFGNWDNLSKEQIETLWTALKQLPTDILIIRLLDTVDSEKNTLGMSILNETKNLEIAKEMLEKIQGASPGLRKKLLLFKNENDSTLGHQIAHFCNPELNCLLMDVLFLDLTDDSEDTLDPMEALKIQELECYERISTTPAGTTTNKTTMLSVNILYLISQTAPLYTNEQFTQIFLLLNKLPKQELDALLKLAVDTEKFKYTSFLHAVTLNQNLSCTTLASELYSETDLGVLVTQITGHADTHSFQKDNLDLVQFRAVNVLNLEDECSKVVGLLFGKEYVIKDLVLKRLLAVVKEIVNSNHKKDQKILTELLNQVLNQFLSYPQPAKNPTIIEIFSCFYERAKCGLVADNSTSKNDLLAALIIMGNFLGDTSLATQMQCKEGALLDQFRNHMISLLNKSPIVEQLTIYAYSYALLTSGCISSSDTKPPSSADEASSPEGKEEETSTSSAPSSSSEANTLWDRATSGMKR